METFPLAVYLACFATSLLCAVLLARSYVHSRTKLLLWSALCFVGLAANNFFLFLDVIVFPDANLQFWRHFSSFAAIALLLYGFIWEID